MRKKERLDYDGVLSSLAAFLTSPAAISLSATTTSRLSESTSGFAPLKSCLALFEASTTNSKRLGILLRQSSTVMRATDPPYHSEWKLYNQISHPQSTAIDTDVSLDKIQCSPYLLEKNGRRVEVFRKLLSILRADIGKDGPVNAKNPLEIVKASYRDLCRLAEQIEDHAQKAPYPHVAQRLKLIAAEKRSIAGLLKDKMLSLGAHPEESKFDIKRGKNHWERIAKDIDDQRALENQFQEYAVLLAEQAPEISDLLERIVADQAHHRESLLDLLARADPQANLS